MKKVIVDHEIVPDKISEETYNCYRLLKLPVNVFESGKYFLKKMGNINTKSVKKIMASVILATRKQKFILSIKEIEDFFFERYGIKFSWSCINKLLIKFDYNSFTAKDYFEKILYDLNLPFEIECEVRRRIAIQERGNPKVNCQVIIYSILREIGFVSPMGYNKDKKITQGCFENVPSLRGRYYALERDKYYNFQKNTEIKEREEAKA